MVTVGGVSLPGRTWYPRSAAASRMRCRVASPTPGLPRRASEAAAAETPAAAPTSSRVTLGGDTSLMGGV